MTDRVAIVVAAGSGERLGLGVPKAFAEVDGRPLLAMALAAVRSAGIDVVIAVVPPGALERARVAAGGLADAIVDGGDTRQTSVDAGLASLEGRPAVIVVHDAARPFASAKLFGSVLAALERWDGVVPAVEIADTVKRVAADGAVLATEPREGLVAVQTPQAFHGAALLEAHERAAAEGRSFTDDASCVEWAGFRVGVVAGEPGNFKITTADDLRRANATLQARHG